MAETLRSIVHPWECDAVEHFTTAYYFRAYSSAGWSLLRAAGLSDDAMAAARPVACRAGFSRELRAGDAYHIDSGLVERAADRLVVGHKLFNSETGDLASTLLLTFEGDMAATTDGPSLAWEEEARQPEIDFAAPKTWSTTARCVVHAHDLDHAGVLDLSPLIHHTSDANVQFQNLIGMTSSYMRAKSIGFATFGYRIRLRDLPRRPGATMRTDTALARMGRSSLWFAHRVVDDATGAPIADVGQFGVHFDRVRRAPATIPDAIVERAGRLL